MPMRQLRRCDFCGGDAAGVYEVLPPELSPTEAEQRRLVLCSGCAGTLETVVDPLLDRLGVETDTAPDAEGATGDPSPAPGVRPGASGPPDGGPTDDRTGGERGSGNRPVAVEESGTDGADGANGADSGSDSGGEPEEPDASPANGDPSDGGPGATRQDDADGAGRGAGGPVDPLGDGTSNEDPGFDDGHAVGDGVDRTELEPDAGPAAPESEPSGPAEGNAEAGPGDESADDGSGGHARAGDDAGDGSADKPDDFRTVMRLLGNREFPVERGAIVELAASAYELDEGHVHRILDYAVDRGVIADDGGTLRRD